MRAGVQVLSIGFYSLWCFVLSYRKQRKRATIKGIIICFHLCPVTEFFFFFFFALDDDSICCRVVSFAGAGARMCPPQLTPIRRVFGITAQSSVTHGVI